MNNKKNIFIFSFLVFVVFGLSACSGTTTVEGEKVSDDEEKESVLPERKADITGLIKSIVGNEIKIMKVEFGGGTTEGDESTAEVAASLTSGTTGSGMGGGGGAGGGSGGTGDSADRIEMMKSRSTGEITVIVPVGIEMYSSAKNNTEEVGRIISEATFESLSRDKMVNIWLNSEVEDRKVAEIVSIVEF